MSMDGERGSHDRGTQAKTCFKILQVHSLTTLQAQLIITGAPYTLHDHSTQIRTESCPAAARVRSPRRTPQRAAGSSGQRAHDTDVFPRLRPPRPVSFARACVVVVVAAPCRRHCRAAPPAADAHRARGGGTGSAAHRPTACEHAGAWGRARLPSSPYVWLSSRRQFATTTLLYSSRE